MIPIGLFLKAINTDSFDTSYNEILEKSIDEDIINISFSKIYYFIKFKSPPEKINLIENNENNKFISHLNILINEINNLSKLDKLNYNDYLSTFLHLFYKDWLSNFIKLFNN